MTRAVLAGLAILLLAIGLACRERDRFVVEPLEQIESLAVVSTSPPRIEVRAVIGDGCSFPQGLAQQREGDQITVTITRVRRTTRECRDVVNRFDEIITLDGPLSRGTYTVTVNGVSTRMEVP